jgi:hypothetical protein
MHIPTVYPDTSVIGGCFDPEFELWSNALLEDFRTGRLIPVLSELLELELAAAPPRVRDVFHELKALAAPPLPVTAETLGLADRYAAHAIVPPRFRNDMVHIALATIANADILVSWNFRHIVRFDKIRAFNAANLEAGYKALAIHSPREVASYESEAD